MATVRLQCGNCQAALQVRAELAGQQGKCPQCGAPVTVPSAPAAGSATTAPPSSTKQAGVLPLGRATAVDMLAEVARRKKSAVMIVFETPADGDYRVGQQSGANVRCYRSPDMSDEQMMAVLEQVGQMTQGVRNAKGGVQLTGEGGPLPYELKGDRLGMTLEEFKTKYARKVGAFKLPQCSDSLPGQVIDALRTEAWFDAAGLVNARVELPSENNSPTIAGVKTELFLYQFVDGQLYRITALFDTEQFHHVREALAAKYGPTTLDQSDPVAHVWENGVSAVKLLRGAMRPRKPSILHVVHHGLLRVAEGRTPQRSTDV
ncbi:MAG: hypothetical protein CMJ58_17760 [Planctomycetaceae bacterium]|nr:hypothetical protein [Planctomycetaceae bacterium]